MSNVKDASNTELISLNMLPVP